MKQRITTGIIGALVFLSLLYMGGWFYALMILGLGLIGFDEFVRMSGFKRADGISWTGYLLIVALILPAMDWLPFSSWLSLGQVIWFSLFIFLSVTVLSKNQYHFVHVSKLWAAAVYIGVGFYYILETRFMEDGLVWVLFILFCTWASDSGAYFTGKWLGRTKLWPHISPNKTVEGSIGGIVWSVIVAISFTFFYQIPMLQAVILGIVIAVIGQWGDLIQSAYKRYFDVKDSGSLLPGHGGVLDRVDSWLIVFPFVYLTTFLY
jgi:phosphatidate cytidylyltransferase